MGSEMCIRDSTSRGQPIIDPNDNTSPGTQKKQLISSVAAEIAEKEIRKKNMIVYKLPEDTSLDKEEQEGIDRGRLHELANYTLGINDMLDGELVSIERLGPKDDEKDRPILVKFSTEERKQAFFKRLNKLKRIKIPTMYLCT